MMETGSVACVTHRVGEADTAAAMGSGSLPVLATPRLAAWMEEAACACVAGALAPGDTSVGVELQLRHLAPTAVGSEVTCRAALTAVDGRRLTYHIEAREGELTVGEAEHTRVVVTADRFLQKLAARGEG